MATKRTYTDFQTITKHNYAQIMSNYQRLVFHWLKKGNSPFRHWDTMARQFWEQVWIDRKKFDRKKGRLSTWLGFAWMGFVQDAATTARLGYEEALLRGVEPAGKHIAKPQVKTTNWGLNPTQEYDSDARGDNALFPIELPSLFSTPDEPQEGKLGLRELISSMSEEDQKLFSLMESTSGTIAEVANALGVSPTKACNKMNAARAKLVKLINGGQLLRKPKVFLSTRPDEYWHEFFKTLAQTTPLESNDWSHAAMVRTRNRWLRHRSL